MRCRVCRGHAVVDIRRHNAAFCPDHFVDHINSQVAKAIKEFKMAKVEDRLLVAVSGGKDSLAVWDILMNLGYDTTGFYLDLGIGGYSTRSKEAAVDFADSRGGKLIVRSLHGEHGFSVPELAALTRRAPCSGCGLNKRYEFNRAALEEGFDVLVTGHNLDDEVATLFGNVLGWNAQMLGRQRPVLQERIVGDGGGKAFVRKIKPLIRIAERESAAYALIRGIDYIVEECPMVEGNTQHRYKEALTLLEEASPGTKHRMYFGFLKNASHRFDDDTGSAELIPCIGCGAPTVASGAHAGEELMCSFCKTKALARARRAEQAMHKGGGVKPR
jgi:tRNA-5-methyluridine54 2-sulfurtransferase